MPAWPTSGSFPQLVLQAGYKDTQPDTTIRTQMDAGPAKVRQRFTAAVRPVSATVRMTEAQTATFDTFFRTGCGGGSIPFTWSDPRTGATGTTFRFVKPPEITQDSIGGNNFTASLELEIMP
jgi:hypothetical protein